MKKPICDECYKNFLEFFGVIDFLDSTQKACIIEGIRRLNSPKKPRGIK